MEILKIRNNHLPKKEFKSYGCVCPKCGSAFVFESSETTVPRTFNYTKRDCTIVCPHCETIITLDKCKEFRSEEELNDFKKFWSEDEE